MFATKTEFPLGEALLHYERLTKDYTYPLKPVLEGLTFYTGKYNHYSVKRDQIWFHEHNRYINPDWPVYERWIPHEYPSQFIKLQNSISKRVNEVLRTTERDFLPNSLLLNRYNTGDNIIPQHQDSEIMFGDNPTVAVYSLGAKRIIRFTLISDKTSITDIELENNSLLIMAGTTQKYYYHELLKDERVTDTRYSFTFRNHVL